MKILFFHHYNSPLGAGVSFLHILKSFDREEYETVVCLPNYPGNLESYITSIGIRVIHSDYGNL